MEQTQPQETNQPLNKKKIEPICWAVIAVCVVIIVAVLYGDRTLPFILKNQSDDTAGNVKTGNKIYDEVVEQVLPSKGFQSKVALGDSVVKLVQNGAIDIEKFSDIYKNRGGFPEGLKDVLARPLNEPIFLTKENANFYINLLWPLGLSNYMELNKKSPINGKDLYNFASTGGWNLGKEENGGAYFNKFEIVPLSAEQENLVVSVAENIYRPCCGNSTFFQDCNHGSALLGFLELGVWQGLTEDELYKEALMFNSFWFPQNYVQLGLYFKAVKNTDWSQVDPKLVLGKDYSSSSGNNKIQEEVSKIPGLVPQGINDGGGSCGT